MKIRFLIPARNELSEAISYYNAQRQNLGSEFREEAWETIQRIRSFPTAWQALSTSIHRCQMNRFPYGLIYAALRDEIVIIAVAHLHRAPEYWRHRAEGI